MFKVEQSASRAPKIYSQFPSNHGHRRLTVENGEWTAECQRKACRHTSQPAEPNKVKSAFNVLASSTNRQHNGPPKPAPVAPKKKYPPLACIHPPSYFPTFYREEFVHKSSQNFLHRARTLRHAALENAKHPSPPTPWPAVVAGEHVLQSCYPQKQNKINVSAERCPFCSYPGDAEPAGQSPSGNLGQGPAHLHLPSPAFGRLTQHLPGGFLGDVFD